MGSTARALPAAAAEAGTPTAETFATFNPLQRGALQVRVRARHARGRVDAGLPPAAGHGRHVPVPARHVHRPPVVPALLARGSRTSSARPGGLRSQFSIRGRCDSAIRIWGSAIRIRSCGFTRAVERSQNEFEWRRHVPSTLVIIKWGKPDRSTALLAVPLIFTWSRCARTELALPLGSRGRSRRRGGGRLRDVPRARRQTRGRTPHLS